MTRTIVLLAALLAVPLSLQAQLAPKDVVQSVRGRYPAMVNDEQIGQMTREVAIALNASGVAGGPFGILAKTQGRNCSQYSCDVICVGQGTTQQQIDLWADSSIGLARPAWTTYTLQSHPSMRVDRCDVIGAPVPPAPTPEPPPVVTPPAPTPAQPCDLTLTLEEIRAMRVSLEEHRAEARKARSMVEKVFTNSRTWIAAGTFLATFFTTRAAQ